jgi:hypothetical protein
MGTVKFGMSLTMDRCPHCAVAHPNMSLNNQLTTKDKSKHVERLWWIYYCQSCGGVVTVSTWPYNNDEIHEIFPSTKVLDQSIPERGLLFLKQATDTIHAPSASIMVSASAIDEMLKAKGLKEGKLYPRINKAAEDHLITEEMAKWAHEVRLEANDQRHADEDSTLPTENDAKRVLDFALALAEFLFVLPSRVQKGLSTDKK